MTNALVVCRGRQVQERGDGAGQAVRVAAVLALGGALLFGCTVELVGSDAFAANGAGAAQYADGGRDAGWAQAPAAPDAGERGVVVAPDAGRDAALDAGRDAAPDPAADAGRDAAAGQAPPRYECSRVCGGTQPVCDHSQGLCVACTEDAHCPNAGHCGEGGRCWPCVENAHCTTPSASQCKPSSRGPVCGLCERDADCAHLPGRPYCGPTGCMECRPQTQARDCGGALPRCNGQGLCVGCTPGTELEDCGGATPRCEPVSQRCVQCTPPTEATDCGPNSCDRASLTCTMTARGSQAPCEPCQSDSECAAGLGCVEQTWGQGANAVSLGSFCFLEKATYGGCANTLSAARPFGQELVATSVDGERAAFCMPATSCPALLDALPGASGARRCTLDADCGASGVEDGQCLDQGPAIGQCSYACSRAYECPASTGCTGVPGLCSP